MSSATDKKSVHVEYERYIYLMVVRLVDPDFEKEVVNVPMHMFGSHDDIGSCDIPLETAEFLGFKLNYVWEDRTWQDVLRFG